MKVQFVQSAHSDIETILTYYQEQGAPEQGLRFVSEIIKKSERLAKYPDSGRIVPEFGMAFLREVIYPPFRVVYRREPHQISVVRIWRSERVFGFTELQEPPAVYAQKKTVSIQKRRWGRKPKATAPNSTAHIREDRGR
jgi:toxin ParE1/3/4